MPEKPAYEELEKRLRELEAAESRLKRTNEDLREYFENLPLLAYNVSFDGMIIDCNDLAVETLGYADKRDLTGKPLIPTIYAPGSREKAGRLVQKWKQEGKIQNEELQIITTEGKKIDVLLNVDTIFDHNGMPVHSLSTHLDISERKSAEQKLKKSEDRLRQAQKMAKLGHWDWEMATGELFWSDEVYKIFGQDRTNFHPTAESFERCIHPDDLQKFQNERDTALAEKRPVDIEHRIILPDGTARHVQERAEIIRDKDGNAVRVSGTVQDITERKKAEEKIKESEERYRTLFMHNPNPIAIIDRKGNYLDANETFLRFVETSRAKLLSMNVFDFAPPGRITGQESNHKPAWEKGGTLETEYDINGTIKLLELNITPVLYDGIEAVIGVGKDITEQKRAQEALKESDEKYRSMMESMSEAAYICTSDFRVEYMNPAMAEKIGRDATGEKCYTTLHGLEEQCPWCKHEKIMKGESVKTEIEKTDTGEVFFVSHSPIFHTNGTVSKLSIYRDITDIRKLEQRIQQAQKMESIGSLAGGIAHDFNNILFPILGISELMINELSAGSPEYENIQEIMTAAARGKALVQQILAVGRQSEHHPIPVHIQTIVKEVLKLVRSTLPVNIKIVQDIREDCGAVHADPTQMHQVAMNLITNAYHAVDENNGQIQVKLQEVNFHEVRPENLELAPGKYAHLVVSDTGQGIAPEIMAKIFDPYFTTKKPGKGTGMGLSVAYGIVKEYGGDIRVKSELGKGTSFHVYLPALDKKTGEQTADQSEAAPGGNESILLVDDEHSIVKLEKQMLERLGYKVTARTSSVDALELFRAETDQFDLVLSDMTMPDMTGDRLAKTVKSIRPGMPVIICTGFSEKLDEEHASAMGINAVLMKPVVLKEMAETVRNLLDGAGM